MALPVQTMQDFLLNVLVHRPSPWPKQKEVLHFNIFGEHISNISAPPYPPAKKQNYPIWFLTPFASRILPSSHPVTNPWASPTIQLPPLSTWRFLQVKEVPWESKKPRRLRRRKSGVKVVSVHPPFFSHMAGWRNFSLYSNLLGIVAETVFCSWVISFLKNSCTSSAFSFFVVQPSAYVPCNVVSSHYPCETAQKPCH